jgi:type IV secretory pathway VirJ component
VTRVVRACAALAMLAIAVAAIPASATIEEAVTLDPFAKVELYRETETPPRVVVLLSGDHGWNRGAVEIARALAGLDALVIGIDLPGYLATLGSRGSDEIFPSADLEVLSQFVQKKIRLPAYRPPVVVGYASGAAMAYAIAAQARPTMFAGAVSLGFCPEIASPRPLGPGTALATHAAAYPEGAAAGRFTLLPSPSLPTSWVAFLGRTRAGCDPEAARRFVTAVGGATLVDVAAGERVLADPESWLPAMRRTLDRLTGTAAAAAASTAGSAGELSDLPLVEVPARGAPNGTLAVILSGDGGWASIDRQLGDQLADGGVGVVGLNSLSYFWTRRTPDGAAADLARIVRRYRAAWQASRVLLIGYSRGADVLPFLAARLPAELRGTVALVTLLGPGRSTDFEFHLTDWLGGDDPSALPTRPEVDKLRGLHVLCVQGADEDDSLCPELGPEQAERMVLAGGHHFGGDYEAIAARIRTAAGLGAPARPSPAA